MNVNNIHTIKTVNPADKLRILKSGEITELKIISKEGMRWKGSIKGKIITFNSNLDFSPGDKIKVQVFRNADSLVLKSMPENPKALLSAIIRQNGLPDTNLSKLLIEQFRTLQIPFSEKLFYNIYKKLEKDPETEKRTVQLLLLALKKGIDADVRDISAIENFLFSDQGNQLNRKQRDILKMFNHISDGNSHWILTAFDLDDTISGRIGVRYSLSSGKSDYAFFLFENADGNWLFSLDDTSFQPKISVFAENDSIDRKTAGELKKLFERLNKIGIITDNQVKKISGFDIFTHGYKDKKIDEMI